MSMTLRAELLRRVKGDATVFIETGTYAGACIELALSCGFEEVHSIELSPSLANMATERFSGDARVQVWRGDSGDVLPLVLAAVGARRAVVWLDAHKVPGLPETANTFPLTRELEALAEAEYREHTVMVDDVQWAGTDVLPGPKTEDITAALRLVNHHYDFDLDNNDTILVARVA